MDMAKIFRAEGITVIMGGFHTSGTINMLSDQEPDIQELYREGHLHRFRRSRGKMGRHSRRLSARPIEAAL